MRFERASGILLHPTSLPGLYGIGDFGPQAYHFLDFLAAADSSLWQILPLGPTGYGDSPYQCFSAFAGNPYLISPDLLLHEGLVTPDDLVERPAFPAERVDYGAVIRWKLGLLDRAAIQFEHNPPPGLRAEYENFCTAQADWLDDFALFMVLKEENGGSSWDLWPAPLRKRDAAALSEARQRLHAAITRQKFRQFMFFRQWQRLHEHARSLGIQIIGDIPIFIAYDSADVWTHPELFYLDAEGKPSVVAGVPPDYFSPTGQLWGNPLYRWEAHRANGYAWWIARLRATLQMVDIIRLDHFRGFVGYWEIPAGMPTAEIGRWVPGPGADLFAALNRSLGDLPIIAEDLGEITPDVIALRDQFGLPGMKILQFAFSGPENPFLPHHYPRNCVAYTGTHDNDTAVGWYETAPQVERDFADAYLGRCNPGSARGFATDLARAVWASNAVFALVPMQDLLELDTTGRMNYPGRESGNWGWRMSDDALTDALQERIKTWNRLYSRQRGSSLSA